MRFNLDLLIPRLASRQAKRARCRELYLRRARTNMAEYQGIDVERKLYEGLTKKEWLEREMGG